VNNFIRRTRPEKTGVHAPLGDLEQAVMREVWDSASQGVLGGEVHEVIATVRPIAITTVLTTLDRLRDKGIVRREREGKAYRYWSAISEDDLQQRIVGGVLDRLIAQFPSAVATYFAQQQSEPGDAASLTEMARRIEEIESNPDSEDAHGR
jgi:predicted transcriptional regulator